MQSSSELFPVALVSAELRGDLSEDIYRLKPGNSPDFSVELALTRLGLAAQEERSAPVILLHGGFSNRRFWYSPGGAGFGPYLVRQGHDVWIAEMRGHGLSPRNLNYSVNSVSDYARFDLPAINAFVREQSGRAPHWIGHSLGGTTLAVALGNGHLRSGEIASLALFGSQVAHAHWSLKVPPLTWLARLLLKRFSYVSGRRFKQGPEDEPIGVALEFMRWHRLLNRHEDWLQGLSDASVHLLAVGGAGDRRDPVAGCRELFERFGSTSKHFLCLGRNEGFGIDYGHLDMLVGQEAQREIWPWVDHWLWNQRLPVVPA
ncbi:alpha/beta fold hydrolase [Pseudomonas sp. LRF_L74]|uniref:alpha/beta fold hydrolase n=1 Tax=Pseudomonas sp. LRF_L74 TaxID=3369422 RepID=UPI003F63C236